MERTALIRERSAPPNRAALMNLQLKSVDSRLNLLGNVLRNNLLGDNQIEDLATGLLVEELDGILHQIGRLGFDNINTCGVIKAFFDSHTSEIHNSFSFHVLCVRSESSKF